jgi:SAM-dependent methyltransferase
MGLHTELMVRAGARVTAFDLSETSVQATSRRLELKGLSATVLRGDAEELPFNAGDFDFVWSWGVIHHSSRTAKIVREIARVLTPAGECRVMVYNRLGASARIAFWRDYILKGGFLRRSFEETLYRSTDGFSARFYIPEHFDDLFRAFFQEVHSEICGLDSDAVPLPGRLRRVAMMFASEAALKRRQAKRGSFIFLVASRLL